MAAAAFFEDLPTDALSDEEEELLQLICAIAKVKNSFIPSEVSVQMWAEKRMPEDYICLCNSSSLVFVKRRLQKENLDAKKPSLQKNVEKQANKQLRPRDSQPAPRAPGAHQIAAPPAERPQAPPPFKTPERPPWVFTGFHQPRQQEEPWQPRRQEDAPPWQPRQQEEPWQPRRQEEAAPWQQASGYVNDAKAFFDDLPPELTPEEQNLVGELVKICIRCAKAKAGPLNSNPSFQEYFRKAYPKGISVEDFLQFRVSENFERKVFEEDQKLPRAVGQQKKDWGEEIVERNGSFYEKVKRGMVILKEDSAIRNERTSEEWDEFLSEETDAWIAAQGEDGFPPKEAELREAIVEFLASCPKKTTSLSGCMNCQRVAKAKSECLPLWIRITNWIERRIGGEVEVFGDRKDTPYLALVEGASRKRRRGD